MDSSVSSGVTRRLHAVAYADLVLVQGEREVSLGRVGAGERCDLGFVDDLLRLRLVVGRFGWSLRLDDVAEELCELVELVGLTDELGT
jgi:hypothetical protein